MFQQVRQLIKGSGSTSSLLVSSSVGSLILRLVGTAATFLLGVQLARYLAPAGLGIYGVVMGIASMLFSAAQFGLPVLATREVSVARAEADWDRLMGSLRWFAIAVAALGVALAGAFALTVTVLPGISDTFRWTSYWAALLVPLMALTILVSAQLRAFDRLVAGQSLEIVVRPAATSMIVFLFFFLHSTLNPVEAMAASTCGAAICVLLGYTWLAREVPPGVRGLRPTAQAAHWLKPAAPLALTDLLRTLDGTYAVMIMGALTTASETGVFRVAASSVVIVGMPLSVLHNVVPPTLARLHATGEKDKLQIVLTASACATFAMALVGALGMFLVGKWLITTLFGAEYEGAWQPVLLLTAGLAVAGFFGVANYMLAMSGGERQLAGCYAASVAVSVLTAIPLALTWGASGVALAAVVGSLVNNLWAWHHVRRTTGLDSSVVGALKLLGRHRARIRCAPWEPPPV
jgi:O-antigen/teichoic acid export membrane protein